MPSRPREHRLAEEAVRAFESALDPRLKFYDRPQPEYGIDGDVEEFDESERATGLHFFVQIKGTDEQDIGKALAQTVKLDTADYYRKAPMPVLMVRYHAPTSAIYTRWFHQHDPYYGRRGKKTLTFRWRPEDVWTPDSAERLAADARAYYAFLSTQLSVPLPIYVVSEDASGGAEAEARLALRAEADTGLGIFRVEGGVPPAGTAWIEVRQNELVAHLATVTAATLHIDGELYVGEDAAQRLAVDSMLLLALAFERVGQDTIASRLAAAYFARSSFASDVDAAFALSWCMARAHRVAEALALAEELDDPDDPGRNHAGFAFGLAALQAQGLSEDEAAQCERVLKGRVKRRRKTHPVEAGRAAMNLAIFHRSQGRHDKAASHYETALKLDPGYAQRAHYWFARAGALWGTGQYVRAADAYGRAIELGSDQPLALALQADCLMYAGQYTEALRLFEEFNGRQQPEDDGEYRLKERALRFLISKLSLEEQQRHPNRVFAVVSDEERKSTAAYVEMSLRQLQEDALWGSAWLNIGVAESEKGDHATALDCHILSTILIPLDHDAWRNAIFTALECAEGDVVEDLLVVGRRLGGDQLVASVIDRVRDLPAEVREPFVTGVDDLLQRRSRRDAPGFTLRLISEDGAVEHFVVGEDSMPPPAEPGGG